MTTDEGFALLEDLAQFGAPVVLFSGGEPLTRPDLLDLAARAVQARAPRGHLHQRHAD